MSIQRLKSSGIKPEKTLYKANRFQPTANTWQTALDISGSGWLYEALINAVSTSPIKQIRITIDGSVVFHSKSNNQYQYAVGIFQINNFVIGNADTARPYSLAYIAGDSSAVNMEDLYVYHSDIVDLPYTGAENYKKHLTEKPIRFEKGLKIETLQDTIDWLTLYYKVGVE